MMTWSRARVAREHTHHINQADMPLYAARFDEVLKFHEPGLAPVARGGEAWHIRPNGEEAYVHRYQKTFGFYEGRAAVSCREGWCHIDESGEPIYTQRYTWCGNFQGGRSVVCEPQGVYFHVDREGVAVYAERWRYAGDYRDEVAVVQAHNGSSTHIDVHGKLLHGRWFKDLDVFHKGYARARDEEGWCHIDVEGQPVYTRRFAAVEPFYNGQARIELFDGSLQIIDESGRSLRTLREAHGAVYEAPLTRREHICHTFSSPFDAFKEGDVLDFARREVEASVGLESRARFFLAGGAFKTLLTGKSPHDLDIWVPTMEDREELVRDLLNRGAKVLAPRPFSDAYLTQGRVVDLPHEVGPHSLEQRLESFDLGLSAVGVEYHPLEGWRAVIHPLVLESVRRRETLLIKPLVNWKYALTTLERMRRYAHELDYDIPDEEMEEVWRALEMDTVSAMLTRYKRAGGRDFDLIAEVCERLTWRHTQ